MTTATTTRSPPALSATAQHPAAPLPGPGAEIPQSHPPALQPSISDPKRADAGPDTGYFAAGANTTTAPRAAGVDTVADLPASFARGLARSATSPTRTAADAGALEWAPQKLARRSSYNYEADCARFLDGGHLPGRVCCAHTAPAREQAPRRPHARRPSFSREDQKHLMHEYLLRAADDAGFSSN